MHRFASSLSCLTALLAAIACADDGASEGGAETGATAETASESEAGSESTSTGPGDGDPGDGDPGDGDPGDGDPGDGDGDGDPGDGDGDPVNPDLVRFIAMGDAGEGNDSQYAVGAAIEAVCANKGGCEFVLYLGDNFYDDGVNSVDDDQFSTKFELPYADLDMPFYVVMGNHDYSLISLLWDKITYQIEYTNYSEKWTLPSKWYTVGAYPNVSFFMMDTTRLMWDHETGAQQGWLDAAIQASDAQWKIALGHHPYYSNGEHGNAGTFEGFPFPPQLAGTTVKEVMDESLCDKVDLYLCGHDHNRQWNQLTCGGAERTTHFIVSGAGAKNTGFVHRDDNPVYWEDDTTPGFLLLELELDKIHTEFYDELGNLDFERDIVK